MRCFFIFSFSLITYYSLSAQKATKKEVDEERVFTKIEITAATDFKAWNAYLKKASVLGEPAFANIPEGVYKVTVQFVVTTYGNIADVKAKNNPGYGLAAKAEKIISGYEGAWKPAIQCGRAVKTYHEQVVEFVVKGD